MFIGIDVGSTFIKLGIVNTSGKLVSYFNSRYSTKAISDDKVNLICKVSQLVKLYKNSLILRICMTEKPFIHKHAFKDLITNFISLTFLSFYKLFIKF